MGGILSSVRPHSPRTRRARFLDSRHTALLMIMPATLRSASAAAAAAAAVGAVAAVSHSDCVGDEGYCLPVAFSLPKT